MLVEKRLGSLVTTPARTAVVDPINRFMSIKNVLTQWSERRRRYKKRKWVALRLDKAIKPRPQQQQQASLQPARVKPRLTVTGF